MGPHQKIVPANAEDVIRENFSKMTNRQIAIKLNVSPSTIQKITKRLGLTKNTAWTNEEWKIIRSCSHEEAVKLLPHRSAQAIGQARHQVKYKD